MRVLTTNLAETGTLYNADGFPLAAAYRYDPYELLAPTLDRCWRAGAAATTHAIVVDLGAEMSVNCAAVFDLYSASYMNPAVRVYSGPAATGPWTLVSALTNGGRRDWGGAWTARSARFWKFELVPNLLAATTPEVAYLTLGLATDLRRGEVTRAIESVDQVVINGSDAVKTGEEYLRLSLRWGTLTAADHAELYLLKRAVGGGLKPFVLWPNVYAPGAVYLGRLSPGMNWAESAPVYTGHELTFTEMERILRG